MQQFTSTCITMSSETTTTTKTLLKLPAEIQQSIYSYVNAEDLAALVEACRSLRDFIAENMLLFKAVAGSCLDGPEDVNTAAYEDLDYRELLQVSTKVRKIFDSKMNGHDKAEYLGFLSEKVTYLLNLAAPSPDSLNIALLTAAFREPRKSIHKDNIEALLCSSHVFERARQAMQPLNSEDTNSHTIAQRQASAKLHVQYGIAQFLPRRGEYRDVYGFAIAVVYDLRNFTAANFWGPYRDTRDAAVDWEKIEAIMLVSTRGLETYRQHTGHMVYEHVQKPFLGATPNSFVHKPLPHPHWEPKPEDAARWLEKGWSDPYNITGTWRRIVNFLDFQDLYLYNFAVGIVPPGVPRPELRTTQACRIIKMELYATEVVAPDPGDHQGYPVVMFTGTSSLVGETGDPNANSAIRGSVRMTKAGEVRWKTVSVFAGEERWASEGIQVGGVNSARGVYGFWFDRAHAVHGPVGPTVFWKESNDIREKRGTADNEDEEDGHTHVHVHGHDDSDEDGDDEDEEEEEENDGQGIGAGAIIGGGNVIVINHILDNLVDMVEGEFGGGGVDDSESE